MVNALFLVKAAHLVLYQLLDAELKRLEVRRGPCTG